MMDNFVKRMFDKMGFDTPEKIAVRLKVLDLISNVNNDHYFTSLWHLTDAYGPRGYMPPQGYDWSGFRDSSWSAINAMREILVSFYGEQV